jgi:hypothetical protein
MQAIMRDAYQGLNWAELCTDCIDLQANLCETVRDMKGNSYAFPA